MFPLFPIFSPKRKSMILRGRREAVFFYKYIVTRYLKLCLTLSNQCSISSSAWPNSLRHPPRIWTSGCGTSSPGAPGSTCTWPRQTSVALNVRIDIPGFVRKYEGTVKLNGICINVFTSLIIKRYGILLAVLRILIRIRLRHFILMPQQIRILMYQVRSSVMYSAAFIFVPRSHQNFPQKTGRNQVRIHGTSFRSGSATLARGEINTWRGESLQYFDKNIMRSSSAMHSKKPFSSSTIICHS